MGIIEDIGSLLDSNEEFKKMELLNILKKYGREISPYDLMKLSHYLREDGKYIQNGFKKDFLEVHIKYFINRIKEILDDKNIYEGTINKKALRIALKRIKHIYCNLEKSEKGDTKFPLIYTIILLYTRFILERPNHDLETPFPGSGKIIQKDGVYYCPAKKNQKKNKDSVCNFCIAHELTNGD